MGKIAVQTRKIQKRWMLPLLTVLVMMVPFRAWADGDTPMSFDELFENHGSVMLIIDEETGEILEANDAAADYYGYSSDVLAGMAIQQINRLTPEEVYEERKRAGEESRNYFLFDHKLASGEVRRVEVYSYPFIHDGRKLLYSIIHDVNEKQSIQRTLDRQRRIILYLLSLFILVQLGAIFLLWRSLKENKAIQTSLEESRRRYQSLFDNMQEGFALHEIVMDESGRPVDYRYLEANAAFRELTGLPDPVGSTVKELLPQEDPFWIETYGQVALSGEPICFENFSPALGKGYQVHAFSPRAGQFATIFFDITKRLEAEKALEDEKERLRITLLSVGDGVIATDAAGRVTRMNRVAEELTGWTIDEAEGRYFETVFPIFREDTDEVVENPVKRVLETRKSVELSDHVVLTTRSGSRVPIADSAAPIEDAQGHLMGAVLVFRDVTEERRKREAIEYMSYHDHLTGLYNRRFFEEELKRYNRSRVLPISVVYADVNGLKMVNDAFGHEEGDRLLVGTAEILKRHCRKEDVIARVGGDEFALILPGAGSNQAETRMAVIEEEIGKVTFNSGQLSVSFGWETKEEPEADLFDVLRRSENHMYRKKLSDGPGVKGKTIKIIMNTLYEKLPYERAHSERVGSLCGRLGKHLGMGTQNINELKALGLFHDIGKVSISESVLRKEGPLTKEEWLEIKKHPESGRRILASAGSLSDLSGYVFAHHERWDGNGYPKGLKGKEIPLQARILALADAYDAMTSERVYKSTLSKEEAIIEIERGSGTQFDPDLARAFIALLSSKRDT